MKKLESIKSKKSLKTLPKHQSSNIKGGFVIVEPIAV